MVRALRRWTIAFVSGTGLVRHLFHHEQTMDYTQIQHRMPLIPEDELKNK